MCFSLRCREILLRTLALTAIDTVTLLKVPT
jgi:hypothetical protein